VGGRDRDWAKLDEDEPHVLDGLDHGAAGRHAPAPGHDHTRAIVWGALAVLVLAVGGFAYTQVPHDRPAPPPEPHATFGTPTSELHAEGPDGLCTEVEWDAPRALWRCDSVFVSGGPIGRAAPYDGPCAHLIVDQSLGRWTCLTTHAPAAPGA